LKTTGKILFALVLAAVGIALTLGVYGQRVLGVYGQRVLGSDGQQAEEPRPSAQQGGTKNDSAARGHGKAHEDGSAHEGGRKNRLAGESSPYLLLHQYNPVDWYPWGEEALEKARREDKPIFLSVGYSTCYWCHVMERESFSDPETAKILNELFVPIKVDREERPDLDEIYMTATQILTQHGGWPNSVFLTPELKPFFAGTYFPPEDRQGRPGFPTVLKGLAQAWSGRRDEVEKSAAQIADFMRRYLEERLAPSPTPPAGAVARRSLDLLAQRFDATWGGFGGAPKFPTPSNLFLALEMAPEDPQAARMLTTTLDQMARGGIYDQLAGGFHRYATDAHWRIPHFEKMLYDNGFLLELFAREHHRTKDPEMARIVRETAAFLQREMTSPEGGLLSAIDAETDGHEGAYYVWTREELKEALGEEEADFLALLLGFAGEPFFEEKHFVLHLPVPLPEQAAERKMSLDKLLKKIVPLREELLDVRSRRKRPLTDDKVLADWNGIGIGGLATAGRVLGDKGMVRQAERAAEFVLRKMRPKGSPLQHSWRGGTAKIDAYLSDYAFFVRGLLALHEATGEKKWLETGADLSSEQIRRLRDPAGGFFVAAPDPDLLFRSKDALDGALPSPNAIATLNLLTLAERTGETKWKKEAEASLKAFGGILEQSPEGLRMMSIAALRYQGGAEEPTVQASSDAQAGGLDQEAESVVEVFTTAAEAKEGWTPFIVALRIAEGWHVNANPASDVFLIPTEVKSEDTELRSLVYPQGKDFRPAFSKDSIRVYSGEVKIEGEVRAGSQDATSLILVYQPCDEDRCLPPVTRKMVLTSR